MKRVQLLMVLSIVCIEVNSQLVVGNSLNASEIIESTFLGNGIFVANVTFSGSSEQIGTFEGSACNLGLGNGIIMSTGEVIGAVGPNFNGAYSEGGGNFGASDFDLELLSGLSMNDAAIVEFDFIATGDSLDFQFVFGSEEYPEYSGAGNCGNVSDVFGFFVSGSGITGPFENNAVNIALIPGSNEFVSIFTLNGGCMGGAQPGDSDCNNCEYYVHNGDGYTSPYSTDPYYIQCDGFTTVLHASIGQLQIGEIYHIKMAIADVADTIFDSYVFLSGQGFVQFCGGEEGVMPDECMLSNLDAQFEYTGICNQVMINNASDINVEYTNCYIETGDGGILDACSSGQLYEYDEPGSYTLNMVYEMNEFQAHFEIGEVVIALAPPLTPEINLDGSTLTAVNYNGEWLVQWFVNGEFIPGANNETLTLFESGEYSATYTNSCGTTSSSENVIFQGIETSTADAVMVFPNPNNGTFSVISPKPQSQVNIFDMTGKLVFAAVCNGRYEIETEFEVGMYTVEITSTTGELIRREKLIVR